LGIGVPRAKPAPARPRRTAESAGDQEALVFREFTRQYGIPFQDVSLLKLALTHRSYLSVTGQGARESNERLEFLGDSVLGLVTSEFLYRRHPNEHEGHLTKVKSLLVSKAILSRRALKMGLGRFVLMSHSEVESGGRQRLSILADAFESVLGAVYLDQGFETARKFIHDHLLADADAIVADKRHTNYKSHLQEYVQSTYRTHPVYRIRSEYGPDHSKHFLVEVMVGRRMLGEGRGHNKKEAEQAAARDAIERVTELRREASEGRRSERTPESSEAAIPPERAEAESGSDSPRRGRRRRGGRGRDARREREGKSAGEPESTPVSNAAPATSGSARLSLPDPGLDAELEPEDDEETDEIELDDDDLDDVSEDPDVDDADDADDADDEDDEDDQPDDDEDDDDARSLREPVQSSRPSAAPVAPRVTPPTTFGRGRRAPKPAPVPSEPALRAPAAEEQRQVDPFAHESRPTERSTWDAPPSRFEDVVSQSAVRPIADEPERIASAPESEAEPAKEALIDEMERAMENFGRRSRPGRRRR